MAFTPKDAVMVVSGFVKGVIQKDDTQEIEDCMADTARTEQ